MLLIIVNSIFAQYAISLPSRTKNMFHPALSVIDHIALPG
jgi:hypothetical protein